MHVSITTNVELSRQDLPMLSANDVQILAQALLTGKANVKKLGNIKKEHNIKSRDRVIVFIGLYRPLGDQFFSSNGSSSLQLATTQELGGRALHCF
ncbi:hypothetical protein AOL_s00054g773 [Orbilia oligospora ATCC 24927]|uniref:Uncharacterized protein n=1 Tax=Arthrobotrys oligospora (strain ATCC 24927 / CBS 115.81 / DSM 1491) TaxID=756982 RepID=G1X7C9_ARTOA|nr:hypothetical protein AOL_s00054g773 [Orbilia oligospora ATCC 24927]EGX51037.1 hypothetical protein AOL_s00054g773 [Orbilia oligospora ATCC 24927]